jgi:EmrB/QacA subfamily drug resistance transporter
MMEAAPPFEGGSTPSLSEDPSLGLSHRAKLEILGAILLALFLGALDQTVVGTALPKIVTDLGGNDLYTWVVTIYLLTSTISVPFYGKLSDIYGRRPLLMIGIVLFLVGSALSGLSQEMWQLILFRGIQGLGAGALFPISLAVIGDLFTPAERGRYQGLFGAVFGISFIIGPALGGFLTDQVSWHWVFYVNLPFGLISLYAIWHLLPTTRAKNASRNLDIVGGVVFTIAMILLLVGLTNATTAAWTDASVGGLIAAGLVGTLIFLFIESRAAEPIVPLDLWRSRTYASSLLATFLVSFGFFGAIIFFPRWFQVVRGDSATVSGYELFPLLIGLIGSSIVAGILVSRTGKYKALVIGGMAIMTVGLVVLSQTLATDVSNPVLWAGMFITGVGIGPTLSVFTIIVQNAVPFSRLGVATSNLTFFRQIGGSVGLAIAGTIFANALTAEVPKRLAPVIGQIAAAAPPSFRDQITQGFQQSGSKLDLNNLTGVGQSFGSAIINAIVQQAPAAAAAQIHQIFDPFKTALDAAFNAAFTYGVAQTFVVGIGTGIAAIVVGFAMQELPLRRSFAPEGAPATGAPATAGAAAAAPATASASAIRPDVTASDAAVSAGSGPAPSRPAVNRPATSGSTDVSATVRTQTPD